MHQQTQPESSRSSITVQACFFRKFSVNYEQGGVITERRSSAGPASTVAHPSRGADDGG